MRNQTIRSDDVEQCRRGSGPIRGGESASSGRFHEVAAGASKSELAFYRKLCARDCSYISGGINSYCGDFTSSFNVFVVTVCFSAEGLNASHRYSNLWHGTGGSQHLEWNNIPIESFAPVLDH